MDCRQAGVSIVASVDEVLWTFVERVATFYPDWSTRQQGRLLEQKEKDTISFEGLALDLVRFSRITQANRKSAKERRQKQPKGAAMNAQSQQKNQQNGYQKKHNSGVCWNCGKKGHKSADCWSKKVDPEENGSQSKDEPERQKNALSAFGTVAIAEASQSKVQNEWIFDTGADVNVCNNLAWYDEGIS